MTKQLHDEIHVLDRIKYLLEEGSVNRLIENDSDFADYIDTLYATLDRQAMMLKYQATA